MAKDEEREKLEMRIAELEDKLNKLTVTKEDLAAARKVAMAFAYGGSGPMGPVWPWANTCECNCACSPPSFGRHAPTRGVPWWALYGPWLGGDPNEEGDEGAEGGPAGGFAGLGT